jgi:hypothetical protein
MAHLLPPIGSRGLALYLRARGVWHARSFLAASGLFTFFRPLFHVLDVLSRLNQRDGTSKIPNPGSLK